MDDEHIPKAIPSSIKEALSSWLGEGKISEIHRDFYTKVSGHKFFQGNCLEKAIFISLPDKKIGLSPVMILSNPCDTELKNKSKRAPRITYCAVKNLKDFEKILIKYSGMSKEEVQSYIANVKSQYVSDVVYLPPGGDSFVERVAILSQSVSTDLRTLDDTKPKVISCLSQMAYYLFLTKLSIHYLRFGDIKSQ